MALLNSFFDSKTTYDSCNNLEESDNSSETFKREFNRIFNDEKINNTSIIRLQKENVKINYFKCTKINSFKLEIRREYNEIMREMKSLSNLSKIDKTKLQLKIIQLLILLIDSNKRKEAKVKN